MDPPHTPDEPGAAPAPARALCARVASGDEEAFTLFYERWKGRVEGVLRQSLGDDHRVPDVCQEVFVKVIRKMPVLESEEAIGAWLTTSARRCAIDALRTARRERRNDRLQRDARAGDLPGDLQLAMKLLERSEDDLRRLVEARVRFGWTLERIGRAFGLTPSAVDGRLKRALRRMRETYEEREQA